MSNLISIAYLHKTKENQFKLNDFGEPCKKWKELDVLKIIKEFFF